MSQERIARVKRVLAGVLYQTVAEARAPHVTIMGSGADAEFLRQLVSAALGPDTIGPDGLRLHPANKTALLLGRPPAADILLLGDLYYSQVVELAGSAELPVAVQELADACGGTGALDTTLARFYDERMEWSVATAGLPPSARERLQQALAEARFARNMTGLVPKLGARTLGIDLHA